MSKRPVSNESNTKATYYRSKNNQAKRNTNNADGVTSRVPASRNSQLSREERGQNLQYRNINMQRYEHMIGSAKDNFADISQGGGPDKECTICCKTNDIFGLGLCRHPVCIECAIRIRVFSNNSQCPVCRADMNTLWLTFVSAELETVSLSFPSLNHPDEERFAIRFQNVDVLKRYEKYLSHVCKLCKSRDGERLEFPTFVALRHHMSSAHDLIYCHICTDNIILFSRERKTYTRDALQRHIRTGDRDDRSLKGHPSCLFCDQRFFDEESRYRHLRKEHFFCQFCETEGKHLNVFFRNHAELLAHYKEKHFLCDFEECRAIGIAFSNQMDLNLHKSKEHSARRAPVPIDFQFNDRQLAGPSRTRRDGPASGQNAPLVRRDKIAVVQQEPQPQPQRATDEFVVVPSAQRRTQTVRYNLAPVFAPQMRDFPSLENSSNPVPISLRPDNFPRLNRVNHPGGKSNSVVATTQSSSALTSSSSTVPSSSHAAQKAAPLQKSSDQRQVMDEFPGLPATQKQAVTNSVWGNRKNTKSVIVGCKMPNSAKVLPQPDVWPDISVTTPARKIEPEQWQEVHAKPSKPDKKARRAQQKIVKDSAVGKSSQMQETTGNGSENLMDTGSPIRQVSKEIKMDKLTGNAPSVKVNKKKNVTSEQSSEKTKQKTESNEAKNELVAEASSVVEDRLAEVENYVEESAKKEAAPVVITEQKSPSLDWFTTTSSSLFSNLSLANIMCSKAVGNATELAALPSSSSGSDRTALPKPYFSDVNERTPYFPDVPPPGFDTAVPSSVDNLLNGPPPGFEGTCHADSAPPGLSLLPPTSQPLLSMTPFISHSDLERNASAALKNNSVKEGSDGMKLGGK